MTPPRWVRRRWPTPSSPSWSARRSHPDMDVTGRLVRLRAVRLEAAPDIAALLADPRLVANLAQWAHAPYPVEQARQWVMATPHDEMHWAIECIADGAF